VETSSSSDPHSIIPRLPRLDFPAETSPHWWVDGEAGPTEFMHALSSVFPQGEKFFIDSVVRYTDKIEGEELQKNVKLFVSQEVQHSAQHWKYNTSIGKAYNHNMDRLYKIVGWVLWIPGFFFPYMGQLAVTCALEHFTAILANLLLNTPDGKATLAKMPKHQRELWIWHALEETEHKAVAFDVYKAVGGGYLRRIFIMLIVSHQFAMWISIFTLMFIWDSGEFFKLKTWTQLFRFFLTTPGLLRKIARPWADYFRPNFHPWDHENSHLLREYSALLNKISVPINAKAA